jgi:hypothetical protein
MRERSSAISLAAITLLEIPLPSVPRWAAEGGGCPRRGDEELVKKIRLTSGGACRSIERERGGGGFRRHRTVG